MKLSLGKAKRRQVDKALTIQDLFDGKNFAFDFVIATLHGKHPTTVNRLSDRVYYILSGTGTVTVGSEVHSVAQDDLVVIKANTPHAVEGHLRYIVITAPPFDPAHERTVQS